MRVPVLSSWVPILALWVLVLKVSVYFCTKIGFLRDLAVSTDTHPTSTGTRHGSTDTHGLSTGTRPYRVPLNPFLLHFKSEDLSIDTRPSSTDTGLTSTGTQVASTDTHVKFAYLVIFLWRVPVLIFWVSVLALKFEFRLNRKDIEWPPMVTESYPDIA